MNDASQPMEGTPLIAPSTTDHPLYEQVVAAEGEYHNARQKEAPVNAPRGTRKQSAARSFCTRK